MNTRKNARIRRLYSREDWVHILPAGFAPAQLAQNTEWPLNRNYAIAWIAFIWRTTSLVKEEKNNQIYYDDCRLLIFLPIFPSLAVRDADRLQKSKTRRQNLRDSLWPRVHDSRILFSIKIRSLCTLRNSDLPNDMQTGITEYNF